MKPLFSRTFFAAISSLIVFSSCERAPVQSSFVSLQLPSVSESGSSSGFSQKTNEAFTCITCLKAFVVQASGAGFDAIRIHRYHANMNESATRIEGDITLEVPVGSQRRFQILALYRMPVGTLRVYYGSVQADLNTEAPKVEVGLNYVGALGGSLMGRYLTTTDEGPTGKVKVSYVHPSGLSFDEMPGGEIINGWFNFYAGHDLDLTYSLEDKSQLFSDLKSTSTQGIRSYIANNSINGVFKNIAHITRPKQYYVRNGAPPYEKVYEYNDLVYGYFSESGVDLSAKRACIQSIAGATSLDNTSVGSSSGDSTLVFVSNQISSGVSLDATNFSKTIFGTGGAVSGDCTALNSGQLVYDMDQITLVKDQYNGRGNDHARSIAGAFTYIVSYDATLASSDPSSGGYKAMKYESDKNTVEYKLRGLPDVFSGNKPVYNSIRLFKKPNAANGGYDDIDCHEKWFADKGFTEVTGFAQSPTLFIWAPPENNIKFTLNFNPNATDGYIACPTNGTDMNHLGGMYLGALGPIPDTMLSTSPSSSYTFSQQPINSTATTSINVTNTGAGPARDIQAFTYGANATEIQIFNNYCPPTLMPGSSCMIDIKYYASASPASHNASLQINYKVGAEPRTAPIINISASTGP